LTNAWSAAYQFVRYKKLKPSKVGALQIHKNDPRETSPDELRAEALVLLK
jgi:hypothetical protein